MAEPLPSRTTHEDIVESPKTHLVLDKEFIAIMKGATPSVKDLSLFRADNTSPVNVTQFTYGKVGQTIRILGDGQMTVVNGANIVTNTGANKLLAGNKVYTFTYFELPPTPPGTRFWVENE